MCGDKEDDLDRRVRKGGEDWVARCRMKLSGNAIAPG